ncbi:MAG TPA: hypothetical protein DCS97_10915 [Planctomycetes bacterium]|nr:hypothetical protein [Planctomycetota bacterium]
MPESYTQVPPNSTGNKMRTRSRVIGADTVHEQGVFTAALPTYWVLADAVALAASKHHLSIMNEAGSGKVIALKKLFQINLAVTSVTGIALRFDFKAITAHSGGTVLTPSLCDSTNPALPAQITCRTAAASVTEGGILWPYTTQNDEVSAANTAVANFLSQGLNWLPEGGEMQEKRLRDGEGVTMKQITTSTVGSFGWLLCFTVDDA